MSNIKHIIGILLKGKVNWIKTVYFNFYYLPLKQAVKFPVFIFRNTKLSKMSGLVLLQCPIQMGMIRIGSYAVGTLDIKYDRTIWQNNGTCIFRGKAQIGSGTKLSVNNTATLIFGDNFCVTGGSQIICSKEISFGENCLLSWDVLIMDTDFHDIINDTGSVINPSKSIYVGDNVWIGCRNTILKGVKICNDVVIASGSKITKDVMTSQSIVGGVDNLYTLKERVTWRK